MDISKRQRLEAAGYAVGDAGDFLGLSKAEAELVELKVKLSQLVKQKRANSNQSQNTLAEKMKSSQSRVAKIEAGDPSVSLDLMFRALFSTGTTRQEIAKAILAKEDKDEVLI